MSQRGRLLDGNKRFRGILVAFPAVWNVPSPHPGTWLCRFLRILGCVSAGSGVLSLYIRLHRSHAPMFTAFPHPNMMRPASEPTRWVISGACPSAYIAVRALAASEAGHRGDGHFDVVLDVGGLWSSAATGMGGSDETLNLARAHLSPIKDASSRESTDDTRCLKAQNLAITFVSVSVTIVRK